MRCVDLGANDRLACLGHRGAARKCQHADLRWWASDAPGLTILEAAMIRAKRRSIGHQSQAAAVLMMTSRKLVAHSLLEDAIRLPLSPRVSSSFLSTSRVPSGRRVRETDAQ